jgi:hypothetical protein
MLRGQRQRLGQGCFGRCKACVGVIDNKESAACEIDCRDAHQRIDVLGIERQGALEKAPGLRHT